MLSCRCYINTHAANMVMELLVRIFLLIAFLITEDLAPFQRVIQPEEMWLYKNPHAVHSTISTRMLFGSAIFVPILVITTFSLIRKDKLDFLHAVLACSLAELLNGVITNSIKLIIGRPRPDFFPRCYPDGVMTADLKCTGDLDIINEGRKSFPSGHSSFSFCAFGFTAFYLAGKLHTFESQGRGFGWRILVTLAPLYVALMVALSRTADYRHHYEDVIAGSLLGLAIAYPIYRQYFPAFTHATCDKSYARLYALRDAMSLQEYNSHSAISTNVQIDSVKTV
nr:phospholipid phosphatase 5-like [Lytechinus pictus]